MLGACQPVAQLDIQPIAPLELLEPQMFFGTDLSREVPSIEPLAIDDRMRAFVATDILKISSQRARVHALIDKLADHGYYTDNYVEGLTQSAIDTFAQKRGNCLSYTHMFIALARAARLNARYELVHAPPTYSASEGVLEHQVHIRVRVILPNRLYRERYISVDFNRRSIKDFAGEVVSDSFARALHLGNNAVEHWRDGREVDAFARIVRAIDIEPRHADHWVNLATFYSRRGQPDAALRINRHALALDRGHLVALAAVVQNAKGNEYRRAKAFLERRRANNAYYQFALAQRAQELNQFADALKFVDRSLELERRNHRFFGLKGKILKSLNNYDDARASYRRALNFADGEAARIHYRYELEALNQLMRANASA